MVSKSERKLSGLRSFPGRGGYDLALKFLTLCPFIKSHCGEKQNA